MNLLLNILLYVAVTVVLVVFFRKAIELFLLLSNKFYKKFKKKKDTKE